MKAASPRRLRPARAPRGHGTRVWRETVEVVLPMFVGEHRLSIVRTAIAFRWRRRVLVGRRFRLIRPAMVLVAPGGRLELGLLNRGFADARMGGQIRLRGPLRIEGTVRIGQGSRVDVGPGAVVSIGARSFIGPNTLLVAGSRVEIGADTLISWDCQILDPNFHDLGVPEKAGVTIGNHVWIGTRVLVLPGAVIPDGVIVAAGSVVRGADYPARSVIAGNPARVVRREAQWSA
jgi:acetyltransferase-like isoleucine patch superfamily enzyme